MKTKTVYSCKKCGSQSPRWSGRCSECGRWNTLVEDKTGSSSWPLPDKQTEPALVTSLSEVDSAASRFLLTGLSEFDRVLGRGLPGEALILLAGDPGMGKSTLALQVALKAAARPGQKIFYISGEENLSQLKERADRLGLSGQDIKALSENDLAKIVNTIKQHKPDLVIVDSVQTLVLPESAKAAQGTVSQIKAATLALAEAAHRLKLPIILIGHVTKQGQVAGPKTLEHLVDVVLYFEGDKHHGFRILRSLKNRFGATSETGVFKMTNHGLEEVKDAATAFIDQVDKSLPGRALSVVQEGSRAYLVEIQSLVNKTSFKYAKRSVSGLGFNRLNMILAVLEKNLKISFEDYDVFANVVGGITVKDPGTDLALSLSLISSLKGQALPAGLVAIGEVGLAGEVRPVNNLKERLKEVTKLGFKKIIIPQTKFKIKDAKAEIIPVADVGELGRIL